MGVAWIFRQRLFGALGGVCMAAKVVKHGNVMGTGIGKIEAVIIPGLVKHALKKTGRLVIAAELVQRPAHGIENIGLVRLQLVGPLDQAVGFLAIGSAACRGRGSHGSREREEEDTTRRR